MPTTKRASKRSATKKSAANSGKTVRRKYRRLQTEGLPSASDNGHDQFDTFEIELAPPPHRRSLSEDQMRLLTMLEATLAKLPVGAAFIVPKKNISIIRRHLKQHHKSNVFKVASIVSNESHLRIYRMKPGK